MTVGSSSWVPRNEAYEVSVRGEAGMNRAGSSWWWVRTRSAPRRPSVGRSAGVAGRMATALVSPRRKARGGLRLQRGAIDHEAVLQVTFLHSVVGFLDLLDRDHLDVRDDAALGAEVQ